MLQKTNKQKPSEYSPENISNISSFSNIYIVPFVEVNVIMPETDISTYRQTGVSGN